MVNIVGKIHGTKNETITDPVIVEAFEHSLLNSILHRHIASPVSPDKGGRFTITPSFRFGLGIERIYLIIADPFKKFVSVREGPQQNEFTKFTDSHGNAKWKSGIIGDIDNVDITIAYQSRLAPN